MKRLLRGRTVWEVGGLVAGVVLIAFGAASVWMGVTGVSTVRDNLKQEYITGGSDMNPTMIATAAKEAGLPASVKLPSCNVTDKAIDTGSEARCFAQYMRIHTLESSGGLTYAQLGRFVAAADPTNPAGTSDEAAALKDAEGKPVANAARNTWITETALTTALNTSFFAERVAYFSVIVGVALLLAGIGFFVVAELALRKRAAAKAGPEPAPAGPAKAVTAK